MTRISPRHPRYQSLRTRARLAEAARRGLVAPEGLIAHGRGEAFDYFLGERSIPSARRAERLAARWLANAERPVLSVNGNVAALAAEGVVRLAEATPRLALEVNLFHRTPGRARAVARRLEAAGAKGVLGVRPTYRIAGLPSDRADVDRLGIARADVCLVPLEDGDRAAALRRRGIRVISIDLNPLSRTSETADLPIVDELTRALEALRTAMPGALARRRAGHFPPSDASGLLASARRAMVVGLTRPRGPGTPAGSRRPALRRPAR